MPHRERGRRTGGWAERGGAAAALSTPRGGSRTGAGALWGVLLSLVLAVPPAVLCASTAGGLILLAAGCGGGGGPTGTDRIDLSDIPRLLRVCEQFKKDCGRFPTKEEGLMALVERPAASDIAAKWKGPYQNDKQVKDPWGHVYAYASPANQRIRIWSVGPDGEAGTRDDYPEAPEVRAPRPSR